MSGIYRDYPCLKVVFIKLSKLFDVKMACCLDSTFLCGYLNIYSWVIIFQSNMPDKQKVTLYLSDDLHRQFKIRSAVDGETMSSMAQRALEFYLSHADLVEGSAAHGHSHQVHSCPQCSAAVTLKDNELALISEHSQVLSDELIGMAQLHGLSSDSDSDFRSPDEGELITC